MTPVASDSAPAQLLETIVSMRDDAPGPKSLAVVELTLRRDEMSPLHVHDEDEAYHVLEGSLVIHAGEEHVRVEAGDAFVAPSGVLHTHRADSDQARYVTMTRVRSVQHYEDFLRAVTPPGDDASAEDGAVAGWLAGQNGIEIVGPPGALP
jgi:quercetin dioxygenase-like cupin family protein